MTRERARSPLSALECVCVVTVADATPNDISSARRSFSLVIGLAAAARQTSPRICSFQSACYMSMLRHIQQLTHARTQICSRINERSCGKQRELISLWCATGKPAARMCVCVCAWVAKARLLASRARVSLTRPFASLPAG